MNKERREALAKLAKQLDDITGEIEVLKDEEQEYFDNMPEGLQQGEKGSNAEEAVQHLDEAVNNIDEAINYLQDAQA